MLTEAMDMLPQNSLEFDNDDMNEMHHIESSHQNGMNILSLGEQADVSCATNLKTVGLKANDTSPSNILHFSNEDAINICEQSKHESVLANGYKIFDFTQYYDMQKVSIEAYRFAVNIKYYFIG
jgi:hypothetical protein